MILVEEVKLKDRLVGVVVAISKGRVSYSIRHPIEKTYNLGRAVEIAVGRARKRDDSIKRLGELMVRFEMEFGRRKIAFARERTTSKRDIEINDALDRIAITLDKLLVMRELSKQTKWSRL